VAEGVKVRWGVVVLASVVGAAFTAAPFVLTAAGEVGFGDVRSLVASTLTNVGTTLLLVAAVFFLERGLLQRVSDTAARSTARVVEQRSQEFTNVTQGLATEIADLRARFADATRADEEAATAPLRRVSDDASFDTVAEALEAANSHGALARGTLTFALNPASDEPELVGFSWRPEKVGEAEVGWETRDVVEPRMTVQYLARRNPDGGSGLPVVETVWAPGQLPDDMLIALRNRMIRSGFGEESKLVTPDLFEYLAQALNDAVAARKADEDAWMVGPLREWLRDGWALTNAGLVSREGGVVVPPEQFEQPFAVEDRHPEVELPPVPEGVTETFWLFALSRARRTFGGSIRGVAAAMPMLSGPYAEPPYTRETSPRPSGNEPTLR
jgi:hypothetical protein